MSEPLLGAKDCLKQRERAIAQQLLGLRQMYDGLAQEWHAIRKELGLPDKRAKVRPQSNPRESCAPAENAV